MARPLATSKPSVNLASDEVRVSRIRREPPPAQVKELVIRGRSERDTRTVVIGISLFVATLVVIVMGFAIYGGWNPRDVVLRFD
jgi:anti-sigma factor RsiW